MVWRLSKTAHEEFMNYLNSAYLISASLDKAIRDCDEYPFNLPAVIGFTDLVFHPQVTFLVGENGSGKSTIVEALAVALGFGAEGGSRNLSFATYNTHSSLHEHMNIVRGVKRPKDGFFLRAESFYNVATALEKIDGGPDRPPLNASYGGKSLHRQSHGEAFLSLIRHRFRGNGLYIMDEPEAALSVARQMEFLALIHELTKKGSQLVIATHSPIIMSYPNSLIYQVSAEGLRPISYEETEQYQLTRYFLNNHKAMLSDLLD
jgi:predicted ATPase